MKAYEAMYIVQPNLQEEERAQFINDMNAIFSDVKKVNEWGMRELAYEINDHKNGYYVVLDVEASPAEVKEFERVANIKEDCIRYIIAVKEGE